MGSSVADACIEGRKLYEEKQRAESDKDDMVEEKIAFSDEKVAIEVVSDGTDGPVVEKIKRRTTPVEETKEATE